MTEHDDMWVGKKLAGREGLRVFVLDYSEKTKYPNGDELPAIWVTEPVHGDVDDSVRICIARYPDAESDQPYRDPYGDDAMYYGSRYYNEAMSYTDCGDREKRVDCFRAAEILYRHAAGRGSVVANLCLGYVYSYDRCEGRYWDNSSALNDAIGGKDPYPREERAFECLGVAARAGMCEACYKYGDLYKHGMGCQPDADEAFRWYARASELMGRQPPVIMGSAALRLAGCFEEGFGCEQDFERALKWYRKAVAGLDAAVKAGETWYERALAGARAGMKRCEQEVESLV